MARSCSKIQILYDSFQAEHFRAVNLQRFQWFSVN